MLFLTANCTQCIHDSFEKIVGMSITHYDCPLAAQLSMMRVTIYVHYSERPLLDMFKAVKNTLVESIPLTKYLIVYSNICSRVLYLKSKIGNYLDDNDDINQHEVIVVHGKIS